MKIRLLTFVIALFTFVSCSKPTFNVKVELQNAEGKKVYLNKLVDGKSTAIDSAIMQNNIVNFSVEEGNPTAYYSLRIEKAKYTIGFFSENNDVTIVGDAKDNESIVVTASYAQQLINEYDAENRKFYNQLRELGKNYNIAAQEGDAAAMERISDEYDQVDKNQTAYRNLFIAKNYSSFVSPYILYTNRYGYELNELVDFVNHFNISQDNEFANLLNQHIAKLQRVEVGQPYLDFTQETPEGTLLSLSELVGKSKLLLVDFWASWCGPCRKENPHVVAVYNEYHEKGFDILGVSLDMKKENWIKAIEDDGLIWHNVSDLNYWNNAAAQDYAVSSIPSNVLINGEGIIIAKDLRGEDLRKKVEEILN